MSFFNRFHQSILVKQPVKQPKLSARGICTILRPFSQPSWSLKCSTNGISPASNPSIRFQWRSNQLTNQFQFRQLATSTPPRPRIQPIQKVYRNNSWNRYGFHRMFSEDSVLYTIIGINTVVFLGWQWARSEHQHGNSGPIVFLQNNFMSSWQSLMQGRWWTVITCNFSHSELLHFGLNMLVLSSFGRAAIQIVGAPQFAVFYLGAGVASAAAHLIYSRFIEPSLKRQRNPWGFTPTSYTYSYGASGSISAATLLFALTYPWTPITLFFVLDVPAILAIGAFISYDVYMASSGKQGRVDSAGHIGGALYGLVYWFLRVRGRRW